MIDAFQPTLPARGATQAAASYARCAPDFNPRSPRGERRTSTTSTTSGRSNFNPRSPRGERRSSLRFDRYTTDFNPRSPRGERPPCGARCGPRRYFNPRSRARGATCGLLASDRAQLISTHAPREGSDRHSSRSTSPSVYFNHAPREGSDASFFNALIVSSSFQPTLPARGATFPPLQ